MDGTLYATGSDAQHRNTEQIDPLTFAWKMMRESGFQPGVTSLAGAQGIA